MARPKPRRAERNAGAFYSPDGLGMIPVPMRTLSDDYHDEPVDPPDDHEPEPEPPGLIERILDRLARTFGTGH
jgi:hypothetical protein